jgi:hypothetical protein
MHAAASQTSPELFNKLLLGEEMSSARSNAPAQPKQASVRAVHSASHGQSSRPTSKGIAAYDTPRGFGDEPLTVDQELAIELESVKRERQQLLDSINQLKAESGKHPQHEHWQCITFTQCSPLLLLS